jgi:phosphoribosylaminoimidazolecarboxamide formyltransferase / IMP cyclohydrolase
MIKQALLSVSDKTGLLEFAQALHQLGVQLLATSGTASLLAQAKLPVTEIADYTGFPEILDGRVKTLHPKIYAGILARRDLPEHKLALEQQHILPICLLVVNLYPFAATVARADTNLHQAIEQIDIGGTAMLRAAAKNYESVTVIVDPSDYASVLAEMTSEEGQTRLATRFKLACKAFAHTAQYDNAIAGYFSTLAAQQHTQANQAFPTNLRLEFSKLQDMRYGENPHQQAALYRELNPAAGSFINYRQLQGKSLSYNNIADADTAWEGIKTFPDPACVIVKHGNPCGVALGKTQVQAYQDAFRADPTSAFGGIIALNRACDETTARSIVQQFVELVIAPQFSAATRGIFASKENIRLLEIPLVAGTNAHDYKRVGGGLLVQTSDQHNIALSDLQIVSRRKPDTEELEALLFAWRVAKFVKSNAVVFCARGMTLGIGAGQMSRIDSVRIASIKAQTAGLSLEGAAVASDAFFPFRDALDAIAATGARSIIHPGGGLRANELIAAADEHDMVMALTGIRHFRH